MATSKNIAERIKKIKGSQMLWKVTPPIITEPCYEGDTKKKFNYIITSCASVFGQPETYVFGADKNGEILDWGELDGSFKGDFDHERAIIGAGYQIK